MTGTINRCELGFCICVAGYYPTTYTKHTLREAVKRYRHQNKLVGKKISWSGNLSMFTK